MFDLSRLGEFVGGLIGQQVAEGGIAELSQRLGELGLDVSQLDGLAGEELMTLLSEQGIDLAQVDAQTLAGLAEQAGIELPIADLLGGVERPGGE